MKIAILEEKRIFALSLNYFLRSTIALSIGFYCVVFFHQVLVELTAIADRMVLSQKPKPCILKGLLSDDYRLLIDGINYDAIETHFLGC